MSGRLRGDLLFASIFGARHGSLFSPTHHGSRYSPSQLLVERGGVGVTAEEWQIFARRIIEWRGATGLHDEVHVALDQGGIIKGLAVSQAIQSLLYGRTLDAPVFLTASAADEDGVIAALLDILSERARTSGCARRGSGHPAVRPGGGWPRRRKAR